MKQFLQSFSSLPLIHSRRVVVNYKRKYVHGLLVPIVQACPGKSVVRTDRPAMTITVDLGHKARKQTNKVSSELQRLARRLKFRL